MILGAHQVDAGVTRLQNALNVLGRVKGDSRLMVAVDGAIGPGTVNATNRALITYIVQGAGNAPRWRHVTAAAIKESAADIAVDIERAAGVQSPPQAPAPVQASATRKPQWFPPPITTTGAEMFPQQQQAYYPPQQPYYPPPQGYPGYYPQNRGSGGLPRDQATLDVKAFIPAQYDHVRLHPAGGLAILAVGVLAVMLISQHRKASGK